jgi:hypothetical protein
MALPNDSVPLNVSDFIAAWLLEPIEDWLRTKSPEPASKCA